MRHSLFLTKILGSGTIPLGHGALFCSTPNCEINVFPVKLELLLLLSQKSLEFETNLAEMLLRLLHAKSIS